MNVSGDEWGDEVFVREMLDEKRFVIGIAPEAEATVYLE
jgi:hypothetical protein